VTFTFDLLIRNEYRIGVGFLKIITCAKFDEFVLTYAMFTLADLLADESAR